MPSPNATARSRKRAAGIAAGLLVALVVLPLLTCICLGGFVALTNQEVKLGESALQLQVQPVSTYPAQAPWRFDSGVTSAEESTSRASRKVECPWQSARFWGIAFSLSNCTTTIIGDLPR